MPASRRRDISLNHTAGQRLERAAIPCGWHSPRKAVVLQLWEAGDWGALQGEEAEQRLPAESNPFPVLATTPWCVTGRSQTCMSTYYVPGSVLGTEVAVVNEISLCPQEAGIPVGEMIRHINRCVRGENSQLTQCAEHPVRVCCQMTAPSLSSRGPEQVLLSGGGGEEDRRGPQSHWQLYSFF